MLFSSDSLEILHNRSDGCRITLADGRAFDKKGSGSAAIRARESAAKGVWYKHHRLLCSRRIYLADRRQRLYSTPGAAFLFGAGGWALSTETCRRCKVREGRDG